VQAAQQGLSSTAMAGTVAGEPVAGPVNGVAPARPQVYEYGHQSTGFHRHNSFPGTSVNNSVPPPPAAASTSNGKPPFPAVKSSPLLGMAPGFNKMPPANGSNTFTNHRDHNSPNWDHKHSNQASSNKHHQAGRKPFGKQLSHKY